MAWRRLLGAAVASLGAPAMGEETEAWDLDALRLEQENLGVIRERLHESRHQFARTAGNLSAVIDSLKRVAPRSEEMREALIESIAIERRLDEVDQRIEQAGAAADSLRQRLRLAYDWEISRLFGALSKAMDKGLLMQMMILWEERRKLGYDVIEPELGRYPVDMTIAASDGPDEIRQKLVLLEDRLSLLRVEARKMEGRIRWLEDQGRMERELWSLARQFHLQMSAVGEIPGGVSVESPVQGTSAVNFTGEGGQPPQDDPRNTGGGLVEVRSGEGMVAVVAPRGFMLELHKLRARRQELKEMEAVLQERIGAFRDHLEVHLQELQQQGR